MKILITICRQVQMRSYHLPTGVGMVSSCLKKAGHQVIMLNPNHSMGDYKSFLERELQRHKPDVVAAGGLGFHLNEIQSITHLARRVVPGATIIIGGPLVTYIPEVAMAGVPLADFGIIGEGEYSTVELVNALEAGSDYAAIKGIIYRDRCNRQRLVQTASREPIDDLDSLPMVDMEGLGIGIYAGLHRPGECAPALVVDSQTRVMPLLTSRGCPFKCTFCVHEVCSQKYRCRSLDSVFCDIHHAIDNYGINALFIYDDLFCLSPARLKEFCQRIAPLDLRWECSMVAGQINPEMLKMMKQSGCCCIGLGVESMSPTVLKSMKKAATVEQIELALTQIYEAEIAVWSNLIFFDPAETFQTLDESLEWYSLHPQFNLRFAKIGYHPGSLIYEEAVKNGLIKDQLKYLQSGQCELNGTCMPSEEYVLASKLINQTQLIFGYAGKLLDSKINNEGAVEVSFCCPYCGVTVDGKLDVLNINIYCPSCNRVFRPPVAKRVEPSPDEAAKISGLIESAKTENSPDRAYQIWCQIIAIDPYCQQGWGQLLELAGKMNNHRLCAVILKNLLLINPYMPQYFRKMAEVVCSLGYDGRAVKYLRKAEHLERLGITQLNLNLRPDNRELFIRNEMASMIDMKEFQSHELFLKYI